MKTRIVAVLLGLSFGFLVGIFTPSSVKAVQGPGILWASVPTDTDATGSTYLTQSWHGTNPLLNWAIDFDSGSGNSEAYARGWAYSGWNPASSPGYDNRFYAFYFTGYYPFGANCTNLVWWDVYDAYDYPVVTWVASMAYLHTYNPNTLLVKLYQANTNAIYNGGDRIATMVDPENPGCPWTARHVHYVEWPGDAEQRSDGNRTTFSQNSPWPPNPIAIWIQDWSHAFWLGL